MAELPPAINGTEQRLDAVIAELRALREELRRCVLAVPTGNGTSTTFGGEIIEIRATEAEKPRRKRG